VKAVLVLSLVDGKGLNGSLMHCNDHHDLFGPRTSTLAVQTIVNIFRACNDLTIQYKGTLL
jgi:hypothetical protein